MSIHTRFTYMHVWAYLNHGNMSAYLLVQLPSVNSFISRKIFQSIHQRPKRLLNQAVLFIYFFFYKLPYLVKISNFLGNFYLCINSACTLKLFSALQEVIFCLDITRKGIASFISVSINSTMIILLEEASILKFSC